MSPIKKLKKRVSERLNTVVNDRPTYSNIVALPKPKKDSVGVQTDFTWPEPMGIPILVSDFINQKSVQSVHSVQTEETMDHESANIKRGRTESSSSHEEMPNIKRHVKKNSNKNKVSTADAVNSSCEKVAPSSLSNTVDEGSGVGGVEGGSFIRPSRARDQRDPPSRSFRFRI